MKSSLEALAALKIEYAKTLHEPPNENVGFNEFAIHLTAEFMVHASIVAEVALVTICREAPNEEDGGKNRFTKAMNTILGFPPYCSYKNRGGELTLVWIDKNQEAYFDWLK